MIQRSRPVLLATAAYFLLTAALTWPLLVQPRSIVPNDPYDPLLNTWIMAWNARTLPLTDRWWNAPQFYPLSGATAYTEHLLGLAPITTPIILLTGDHLLAYNISFFLAFVLCGLSAYYLGYVLTRSHGAAFVAGLAFAFAPYRMSQLAHIQVLSSYWMPLSLAGLHQYLESPERRVRYLVLFAGAWMMQALACGYYLFFLTVLIGLWVLWFAFRPGGLKDVLKISGALAAAALLMSPVLYGYWSISRAHNLRRSLDEIESFSADIASILKAPENIVAWRWVDVMRRAESDLFPGVTLVALTAIALVLAWRAAARYRDDGYPRAARVLLAAAVVFLGVFAARLAYGPFQLEIAGLRLLSVTAPHKPLSVAVLCLLAAGLMHPAVRGAWRHKSSLAFYSLAAIAMWIMALGPAPTLMGNPALYKAPYAWLLMLPGVDGVRVPARFWMLAVLCLSAAGGLAVARLGRRWPRAGHALVAVACAGVLIDGWPVAMRIAPRPDDRPNHARAVMRLDLPLGRIDTIALFRAGSHHRPLVNGYSGYFAVHYWALAQLVLSHDPAVFDLLTQYGAIEVTVDHEGDPDAQLRAFAAGYPQSELVYTSSAYSTYRIPRNPVKTELLTGTPLAIAGAESSVNPELLGTMTDDDLLTRWHAGRQQEPEDWMKVDLGRRQIVTGVQLFIGGYTGDFPRELVVQSSPDGETWSEVWRGRGAPLAMAGALRDPQLVPVSVQLPEHETRYLRFVQMGRDPIAYWTVAELRVLGR